MTFATILIALVLRQLFPYPADEELQKRIVRIPQPVAPHRDGVVNGSITISTAGTVTDIHFSDGEKNLQSAVRKAARRWSFRPSDRVVTVEFTVTFRDRRGSYTLLSLPGRGVTYSEF